MGARNPKEVRFPISLTGSVNSRLEAVADKAGANKTVLAAMCVSAGLALYEGIYQVGNQPYVDEAAKKALADKVAVIVSDVHEAVSGK